MRCRTGFRGHGSRNISVTTPINFGTDGWRAIIADEFTFENVGRCAQGLADYLKATGSAGKGLVVGHDTRFLSREFAETVASVMAANEVRTHLAETSSPTPVLSFSVLNHQAAGAAIITASHNPGIWNGFKFKPDYAGSATQEITNLLEHFISSVGRIRSVPIVQAREQGWVINFDPAPSYIEKVSGLVDLEAIRSAGLNVRVDAMFGAGAGYIPRLVSGGATVVDEMHGIRNPAFPGMEQPEPIAPNLGRLMQAVKEQEFSVGLALDGDADRIGVVDEHGSFITTLEVFSLLAFYLLEEKGQRGPLVKGVTSSMMLNKLAQLYGVDIHEMRVGFKYIGPKMSETDALMAGEESGGFSFRGHIPERDGILSGLFVLEYMARTGKTPSELVRDLFDRVGEHYYHRRDVTFDAQDRDRIQSRLDSPDLTELAGMPIRGTDAIDGRRLLFDNAWLISRFSGTEPLLRVYAEADSQADVENLLDAATEYLGV